MTSRYVQTNGIRLHYLEDGTQRADVGSHAGTHSQCPLVRWSRGGWARRPHEMSWHLICAAAARPTNPTRTPWLITPPMSWGSLTRSESIASCWRTLVRRAAHFSPGRKPSRTSELLCGDRRASADPIRKSSIRSSRHSIGSIRRCRRGSTTCSSSSRCPTSTAGGIRQSKVSTARTFERTRTARCGPARGRNTSGRSLTGFKDLDWLERSDESRSPCSSCGRLDPMVPPDHPPSSRRSRPVSLSRICRMVGWSKFPATT